MTTWSVARMSLADLTVTEEVLLETPDEAAARLFFEEKEDEASGAGGAYELRRDGQYVCLYACTLPEAKR